MAVAWVKVGRLLLQSYLVSYRSQTVPEGDPTYIPACSVRHWNGYQCTSICSYAPQTDQSPWSADTRRRAVSEKDGSLRRERDVILGTSAYIDPD